MTDCLGAVDVWPAGIALLINLAWARMSFSF